LLKFDWFLYLSYVVITEFIDLECRLNVLVGNSLSWLSFVVYWLWTLSFLILISYSLAQYPLTRSTLEVLTDFSWSHWILERSTLWTVYGNYPLTSDLIQLYLLALRLLSSPNVLVVGLSLTSFVYFLCFDGNTMLMCGFVRRRLILDFALFLISIFSTRLFEFPPTRSVLEVHADFSRSHWFWNVQLLEQCTTTIHWLVIRFHSCLLILDLGSSRNVLFVSCSLTTFSDVYRLVNMHSSDTIFGLKNLMRPCTLTKIPHLSVNSELNHASMYLYKDLAYPGLYSCPYLPR
jgi:hypothetical protein